MAMAQSLSNVLLHIVFSTKNRHLFIDVDIEDELFKYVAGICRELKCPSHRIGGADDHIHIACTLARTVAISKLVEEIKTGSSKWIRLVATVFCTSLGKTVTVHFQSGNRNWMIYAITSPTNASIIGG
jgi:REP element-mobilizing transposase RayT